MSDGAADREREARIRERGTTHWEGCWRSHPRCAEARVEKLEARVERYREHLDEFAELVEHVTDLGDGSGLDALAGTVRNREIEDGRWSDLNGLYRELVDLRAYAQRAHRAFNDGEDDG